MTSVGPGHIMRTAARFAVLQVLLSAVGLRLFTRLAESPMTLEEIISEYGLRRLPAMDFLDLLVSIDLLDRDADGEGASCYGVKKYPCRSFWSWC